MLKKIFGLILLNTFLVFPASYGQKLSSSEMRKQQQVEEEEKEKEAEKNKDKNLSARERKALANIEIARTQIFNDNAADFENILIPDKWKSESAVVIFQKMDYSYLKEKVDLFARRRIKLVDKAAVDYFSEFYFVSSSTELEDENIGIRIIKPNGQVAIVSTKEAKNTNEEIPSFYQSRSSASTINYKKLAIPNLEAGDIIDYFNRTKELSTSLGAEYSFSPFIFTLSTTYPIIKQLFTFTIDRGFYINFNSYNGAPKLREAEAAATTSSHKKVQLKTYVLEDFDREKTSKDIWNYVYRTAPSIKFQVFFMASSNKRDLNIFVGEQGKLKSKVTPEEIQVLTINKLKNGLSEDFSALIIAHLRKTLKNENDPEKIAHEAYYYFRYLVMKFYYSYVAPVNQNEYFYVNDEKFVNELLKVFEYKKIDAQVVTTVARSVAHLNDLLLSSELQYGVRIRNSNGKFIYLFPFSNHSTIDFINSELEGAEAYAFTLKKTDGDFKYENIIIPASSYKQNVSKSIFTVNFDNKIEHLKITKKNVFTGQYKDENSTIALHNYEYRREDDKKYDDEFKEEVEPSNKSRLAEYKIKTDADKEEKAKQQTEVLKSIIESDYDLVSYDSFELIASGRYDESAELVYTENFSVKNLVSKAGKNYIFEIGKLIGKQFELGEKDMSRENDIYLSYAKSLTNEITITIPDGYKAEGLEDLAFNVDNPSGTFTSIAKQEGNKIILTTLKAYKNNFDKKENWPNLTAALEAAYKFSQKKIILKKKSL